MKLSVILCTHNPRPDHLSRTLAALRSQTLPLGDWELLIVDNASQPPVATAAFADGIAWQPNARLMVEHRLGVAYARPFAVTQAHGEYLLFVDDDNLLDPDYLATALRIGEQNSHLGTWGAARLLPEFEVAPAPELEPWMPLIALWDLPHDVWANIRDMNRSVPAGAGMCFRQSVAEQWIRQANARFLRFGLPAMEDVDLALTACDMGLGTGVFTALRLTHLIPAGRVQLEYLLKLSEDKQYSEWLFRKSRGLRVEGLRGWCKQVLKLLFLRGVERRFQWRLVVGQARARRLDTA